MCWIMYNSPTKNFLHYITLYRWWLIISYLIFDNILKVSGYLHLTRGFTYHTYCYKHLMLLIQTIPSIIHYIHTVFNTAGPTCGYSHHTPGYTLHTHGYNHLMSGYSHNTVIISYTWLLIYYFWVLTSAIHIHAYLLSYIHRLQAYINIRIQTYIQTHTYKHT